MVYSDDDKISTYPDYYVRSIERYVLRGRDFAVKAGEVFVFDDFAVKALKSFNAMDIIKLYFEEERKDVLIDFFKFNIDGLRLLDPAHINYYEIRNLLISKKWIDVVGISRIDTSDLNCHGDLRGNVYDRRKIDTVMDFYNPLYGEDLYKYKKRMITDILECWMSEFFKRYKHCSNKEIWHAFNINTIRERGFLGFKSRKRLRKIFNKKCKGRTIVPLELD